MITKRSISKPNSKRRVWRNRDKQRETPCFPCSRPLSSSQTATRHTFRHAPNGRRPPRMGIEPHHNGNHRGVAVREPKSTPIPLPDGTGPSKPPISSTPASPHGTVEPFHAHGAHTGHEPCPEILRRKEVIQPHLPVRLPCYDLVPITSLTLDGSLPQGVRPPASGAAHFHDLTGGVYKARERIHRDVADSRLLATPPSRSRVADCDPN